MDTKAYQNPLFYPPGGILLWIIIFLELITFGMGMLGLAYSGSFEREIFRESSGQLSRVIGTINTLILLSSGYAMAAAVHAFQASNKGRAKRLLVWTASGGLLFVVVKSWEYYEKISLGIGLGENTFFTFYWLLTGFHLIHVFIGLIIIGVVLFKMRSATSSIDTEDLQAVGAFWHMCDLIWLLLFPALYLIW
ncbi:cytochrome c oxidase subunit 3 [Algoriphagus sp.]|uniref:cytochrome c oxidase subunit 3 n=1 Tax=Algoriphagus sp. TaxID=1872435 RepID=UPI00328BE7A8